MFIKIPQASFKPKKPRHGQGAFAAYVSMKWRSVRFPNLCVNNTFHFNTEYCYIFKLCKLQVK